MSIFRIATAPAAALASALVAAFAPAPARRPRRAASPLAERLDHRAVPSTVAAEVATQADWPADPEADKLDELLRQMGEILLQLEDDWSSTDPGSDWSPPNPLLPADSDLPGYTPPGTPVRVEDFVPLIPPHPESEPDAPADEWPASDDGSYWGDEVRISPTATPGPGSTGTLPF